jgi:signal transduction histidine kinase
LNDKKEVINKKIQEIINILDNYNSENLLNELKSDILLKLNDIKNAIE